MFTDKQDIPTVRPFVRMEDTNSENDTYTDESYIEPGSMRQTPWQFREVELPIFKMDLLIMNNFEIVYGNENRRISYNRSKSKVILKAATLNDLQELHLAVLECIDNIVFDCKKLPDVQYELLTGGSSLENLQLRSAESQNIKVVYQCDAKKNAIRCYAFTIRESKLGVQLLEEEITQLKIQINGTQLQLLQGENWVILLESLQTDCTRVHVTGNNDYIVIESLIKNEAKSCYNDINQYLASNTRITKSSVILEKSKARCFQSRLQDSFQNTIRLVENFHDNIYNHTCSTAYL